MTTRLRRYYLSAALGALIVGVVLALATTVGAQTPSGGTATPGETTEGNETPIIQPTGELVPTSTEGEAATPTSETPESSPVATEEPTPGPEVQTVVRLSIPDTVEQPVPEGEEFEVQVNVEKVEHLAGFEFAIGYDPEKLEPVVTSSSGEAATVEEGTPVAGDNSVVKTANLGQVLLSGGRSQDQIVCSDPRAQNSTVVATCSILEAPVCAGGAPGASGDGLLASVFFKAKGGGTTTIDVTKSTLVLDDVAPPCPQTEDDPFVIQTIPHRREGVDVELKSDDSSNMLLIGGIILAVVIIAVVGGGGYLYYRRRQAGAAPGGPSGGGSESGGPSPAGPAPGGSAPSGSAPDGPAPG